MSISAFVKYCTIKSGSQSGTPQDWPRIEAHMGTPLPFEYKRLVDHFGLGSFADEITLFTPDTKKRHLNLLTYRDDPFEMANLHRQYPDAFPFPAYPEAGGLLGFGAFETWDMLYWQTAGQPDDWPIIVYENKGCIFDKLEMSLTEALTAILSGVVRLNAVPDLRSVKSPEFVAF